MAMTKWKGAACSGVALILVGGAALFWLHRRGEDPTVYLPTPPFQLAEPLVERYQSLGSFQIKVERVKARESRSLFQGWEREQDRLRDKLIVKFQPPNRILIVQEDAGDPKRATVAVCDGASLWSGDSGNAKPAPLVAADLFDLVELRGLAALWRRAWTKIPLDLQPGCRASQEGPLVRLRFVTKGIGRRDGAPGESWLDFHVNPEAKTLTAFESWSTHELAIATARYGEIERYSDLVVNPSFAKGEFKLPTEKSDGEGSPH
ncbi:MAG: hypothetical protein K8T20_01240 [Planctomycetes bacterium]|nr:hypothetical protein [Planctomycetota bacterium]